MENKELVEEINKNMSITLPAGISLLELADQLSVLINRLIQSDFEKLIRILYRIDVSESKLKQLLQQDPGKDAGKIIAELVIERQLQKIETRKQFKPFNNDNSANEEKW